MIYLKKYFESIDKSNLSITNKIDSIIDMFEYLSENDIEFPNFKRDCNQIFYNCLIPFKYKLDRIKCISKIESDVYKTYTNHIEGLYKLSLLPRFDKTKEDILNILQPVLKIKNFNQPIITNNIEIKPYYNYHLKPSFSLKLELEADIYHIDRSKIQYYIEYDQSVIKDIEKDFYYLKNEIIDEIEKLQLQNHNLSFKSQDYAHLNDYYHILILLSSI